MLSSSRAFKIRTRSVAIVMAGCLVCCGCEKEQPAGPADATSKSDTRASSYPEDDRQLLHDEQEEPDPDQVHGINGGQVFTFEPAEFMGEWLVTNDAVTRIFLLDAMGKSNTSIKVDDIVIKRGDTIFTLDPEDADSEGKAAVYSLQDQDLSIAINLGVEVVMQIGEKSFQGKIQPAENQER